MSESKAPEIGSIAWHDLTVENADEIRSFYEKVIGWKSSSLSMGNYDDFCMNEPASGETVAGICHARGENAKLRSLPSRSVRTPRELTKRTSVPGTASLTIPVTVG